MVDAWREPLPSRSCVGCARSRPVVISQRDQHFSHLGDCIDAELWSGAVSGDAEGFDLEPDEATVRDADRQLGWLGDEHGIGGPTIPFFQQRFGSDAAIFFVDDRAEDDITGERQVPRCFDREHAGGEPALHVVSAAPIHPPSADYRVKRGVHAFDTDHIGMGVQHQGLAAAASACDQDDIRASGSRDLPVDFQPGRASPIGDEFRQASFAGSTRHEVGVDGVDGDQVSEEGVEFAHGLSLADDK